jgi:hypothetical protein
MQRTQYTPEQKAAALDLLATVGKAEAGRRSGIPVGTIAAWGSRCGVTAPTEQPERRAQVEARALTVATRKAALAERMLTKAEQILDQLDASVLEKHVKVVSHGARLGSKVEIVDVVYDRPPTADQKRIVDAVAVLVDKIQLLTGEATTAVHVMGEQTEPAQRGQLVSVVAKLAERAAA